MDLVDHLEGLYAAGGAGQQNGSVHPIEHLHAALRALLTTATTTEAPADNVDEGLQDPAQSSSVSLWDDVIRRSHPEKTRTTGNPMPGAVTARLIEHLHSVSDGDESVYRSVLSDVQRCLGKQGGSDEEASALLAETLGFDQLDLVTDLVREKEQVCADLLDEVSAPQPRRGPCMQAYGSCLPGEILNRNA